MSLHSFIVPEPRTRHVKYINQFGSQSTPMLHMQIYTNRCMLTPPLFTSLDSCLSDQYLYFQELLLLVVVGGWLIIVSSSIRIFGSQQFISSWHQTKTVHMYNYVVGLPEFCNIDAGSYLMEEEVAHSMQL